MKGGRKVVVPAPTRCPVSSASTASAGHVAGLALVGRHPEGGVALQMLDRA